MDLSDWIGQLDWRAPAWLLLALQPWLILALRRTLRHRSARGFAAPHLLPWLRLQRPGTRSHGRSAAHVMAWTLAAAAAAGPRLPQLQPGQTLQAGVDWMLVVDASRSMQATDIAPSRLKRARIEALQLLAGLHGDRVGLIVYAGEPHLVAPPTYDFEALGRYLELLQPGLMPTRGSRPDRALDLARDTLSGLGDTARAVLLITDDAGDAALSEAAAQALHDQGIALYVLGMGSASGAISAPGDDHSATIDVPLQHQALTSLARTADGRYATVADDDSDLQRLYYDGIATRAQKRQSAPADNEVQWRELYPWLLLPALLLFAITLWPETIARGHAAAVLALGIAAVAHAPGTQAADTALGTKAYQAYQQHQFQTARDLYARMTGYEARLGEGASAYRLGDYSRAVREFTDAVLTAGGDRQRAAALLNLGNGYFQLGDYHGAVTAYQDALLYQPQFDAAQRNLALAKLVAEAVDRQLAGSRPGRGRRNAEASRSDGFGPRALDESNPEPDDSPPSPERQTAQPDWSELIARGLQFAQVAASGTAPDSAPAAGGEASAGAAAHMAELQQQPATLWRRVFEQEEGFPAPLPEPRTLPGVPPW